MSRFRTITLSALGAGVICMSGCVSAEKNVYRVHLGTTVAQSPADDEAILMLLGREPTPSSVAVVEVGQLP